MESSPKISINLVVKDGEKYIRPFLNSIKNQNYSHADIELNAWDNASSDSTREIIKSATGQFTDFGRFNLVESKNNVGMWPGQEKLLGLSGGKYILAIAVDVMLSADFIKSAVEIMEADEKIGALQPKIYSYGLRDIRDHKFLPPEERVIDTCGFMIFKSRRLINMGHGEEDRGQFSEKCEIFGVEGAAPFFRKSSFEDLTIQTGNGVKEITDHDFFWYGDDFDLAWRMRLFGWKEIFAPSVVAWHDRQTTKNLRKGLVDFIRIRRSIPIMKRRLDWRNTRFTIIKNDYIINILRDLPRILKREVLLLCYIVLFEPAILAEILRLIKLLPRMLAKRRQIMQRTKVSPAEISRWFY